MDGKLGSAYYDLDLKGQPQFVKKIGETKTGIKDLARQFEDAKAGSDLLLGGITAIAVGVVAYGASSVQAYKESQTAQAQLEHAVLKVTKATKKQLQETERLAEILSIKGVLDDDAIKVGLAQLSTFGLSNKAVRGLGKSLADLAVNQFGVNASGEQLAQTANMIAKALNGQFGVLEKSGIRFTKAQIKMITFGKEMDKVKAINQGFAQNLKFTNDVALKTSDGLDAHLSVQLGGIQEQFGEAIENGIMPFKEELSLLLDDILSDGTVFDFINNKAQEFRKELYILSGAIAVALIPALAGLAASIWATVSPLIPFLLIGAGIGLLVDRLVQNFGGWQVVMTRLKIELENLWGVIGPILLPALESLWQAVSQELLPALKNLWGQLAPILIPTLQFLAKVLGGTLLFAIVFITNALMILTRFTSMLINIFSSLLKNIREKGINGIVEFFRGLPGLIADSLKGLANAILKPFDTSIAQLKPKLEEIKKKIADALNPFIKHSPSLVDWVTRGTSEIEKQYSDMFSRLETNAINARAGLINGVKGMTNIQPMGIQGVGGTTNNTNITIPMSGILTQSPGELKEVAMTIVKIAKKAMEASGQQANIRIT